jgi:hypothetical protein
MTIRFMSGSAILLIHTAKVISTVNAFLNAYRFTSLNLSEHTIQFLETIKSKCDRGLEELGNAEDGQVKIALSQCPVRSLREVREDGSDIFLGDIEFSRCEVEALLEGSEVDKKKESRAPCWASGDCMDNWM